MSEALTPHDEYDAAARGMVRTRLRFRQVMEQRAELLADVTEERQRLGHWSTAGLDRLVDSAKITEEVFDEVLEALKVYDAALRRLLADRE